MSFYWKQKSFIYSSGFICRSAGRSVLTFLVIIIFSIGLRLPSLHGDDETPDIPEMADGFCADQREEDVVVLLALESIYRRHLGKWTETLETDDRSGKVKTRGWKRKR